MTPSRAVAALALLLVAFAAPACGPSLPAANGRMRVVAGENVWGDIAAQIGGAHVVVTSIIHRASDDPHEYEINPRDAALVASARVVIANGLGYDDFVGKLLSVTRGRRTVVTIAKVLGVRGHDANPHLWYAVGRVHDAAAAIEAAFAAADPANAHAYAANLAAFDRALQPLLAAVANIRARFAGTPVAYTERVAGDLLDACGLHVRTPSAFARAIEDGTEPSAGDADRVDALLRTRAVKAFVYNEQAESPVTAGLRRVAERAGVPVVAVTETMPAGEPDYQTWIGHEIEALLRALEGVA